MNNRIHFAVQEEVIGLVYLFLVDEHGGVEGFCSPVNYVGGLGGRHVDQHTLRQEQCR